MADSAAYHLGTPRLDFTQGFGHVRTSNVFDLSGALDTYLYEDSLSEYSSWNTSYRVLNVSTNVVVTLVWNDPPGSFRCGDTSNGYTSTCLVHDLDLKVFQGETQVYSNFGAAAVGNYSGEYDIVNNVEKITLEADTLTYGETIAVEVVTNGLSYANTQKFAVVITGILTTATMVPSIAPSPSPTVPPTISPTHIPTPLPTEPPTRPSAVPTPLPSQSPSELPTLSPSPLPTMAPTSDQTVNVAVAFVLTVSSAPSAGDVSTLKSTVSLLVGVSETKVKHFQVLSQPSETSRRLGEGMSAHRASTPTAISDFTTTESAASIASPRNLVTSYEWSTSFEVAKELDESSTTSTSNWEANISSSLAQVDVAASDALLLNITVRAIYKLH